jgi:small subunit ribosomal protein S1
VVEVFNTSAQVELGDGIQAGCRIPTGKARQESSTRRTSGEAADLASLRSMLEARWKGAARDASPQSQEFQAGQVRSFRITKLDRAAKKIEVELVSS